MPFQVRPLLAAALIAVITTPATAGLIGTTVDVGITTSGLYTLTSLNPGNSATVAADYEFTGCLGASVMPCDPNGLVFGIDISDDSVRFDFFGGAVIDHFVIHLTGFDLPIQAAALASETPPASVGTFALQGFTSDSMRFVGSGADIGFANNLFQSAPSTYLYSLSTAAVPEPGAMALASLALLGLALTSRRQVR